MCPRELTVLQDSSLLGRLGLVSVAVVVVVVCPNLDCDKLKGIVHCGNMIAMTFDVNFVNSSMGPRL